MAKIPLGLSLDKDDAGFVLRRKKAKGKGVTIRISEEDLLGLKGTIDLWQDRILSARQPKSGAVQPIVALPVVAVRLVPDALRENILLTVVGASEAQTTLSLPRHIAEHVATEIDILLGEIAQDGPTQQ